MNEITRLREPYSTPERQQEAAMMGTYIFLATEIMLFGGLFLVIAWLRYSHAPDVVAASKRMHLGLGALNTAMLLTSSALVALSVAAAREGKPAPVRLGLCGATLLGLAFLAVKAMEYRFEYREELLPVPGSGAALSKAGEHLFMNFYLISTGLHAIHLTIGVLLLAGLLVRSMAGRLPLPDRAIVVTVIGLYWHFVDIVWIFLFPLLYLAR